MAEPSEIQEFPNITNKLAAPTKKSLFERQKAEAEAKRLREEAETAAVYEDFVKSFDDEQTPSRSTSSRDRHATKDLPGPPSRTSFGAPPKRHFAGHTSGPPTRGAPNGTKPSFPSSGPGRVGPTSNSLPRKRAQEGPYARSRNKDHGLFAFEDASPPPVDPKSAFQDPEGDDEVDHEDDEDRKGERPVPKPALHLSKLPPGTSLAVIRSYLPPNLVVDNIRILPPTGPGSSERRSMSAVATLGKDTPASDIDAAVNALQNTYLGRGYQLSVARHLSSAAMNAGMPLSTGVESMLSSSMPFGARPVLAGPAGSLNRAPPPSSIHRGGYAPPSSYASAPPGRGGAPPLQVTVSPPSDLKQLRLIHKTLEALLTYGPEFEALLMTRPEVQRDQRWAWLWDPRSTGGVWYRWRLWQILSRSPTRDRRRGDRNRIQNHVFDGAAPWVAPEQGLRFEYTTRLDELVSDSDYDSSEEDSGEDDNRRQHHHRRRRRHRGDFEYSEPYLASGANEEKAYLTPLRKAALTHLLARLPTSNAKLRKGDVARITAFATQHAGEGADEVVDLIVSNVQKPFAFTRANPDRKQHQEQNIGRAKDEDVEDRDTSRDEEDTSSAKLVALYVVSDLLSSSSTSGVRHAWRYRQLFETAFRNRRVFEGLGLLERRFHWGRLRAEKWKRSVGSVLTLWEGWCVFPQASQEHFLLAFTHASATSESKGEGAEANVSLPTTQSIKSKWRTVDEKALPSERSTPLEQIVKPAIPDQSEIDDNDDNNDDDGEDVDGQAMDDDGENLDGEPMEDIDGESMEEDDEEGVDGELMEVEEPNRLNEQPGSHDRGSTDTLTVVGDKSEKTEARKKDPQAEDMFADSDDDT